MKCKFLLIALLAWAGVVSAQIEQPYSWSVSLKQKTAHPGDIITVSATATIKDGWHIYSTKSYGDDGPLPTQFELAPNKYFAMSGAVKYPKPLEKHDEAFQITAQYFEHSVTFSVPVRVSASAPAGKQSFTMKITAMACNDRMCMPPKSYDFDIPVTIEGAPAAAEKSDAAATALAPPTVSNDQNNPAKPAASVTLQPAPATSNAAQAASSSSAQGEEIGNLESKGLLWFIGFAFSMGLLSLLTPCVFPMIPLTVSFFTKRGTTHRGEAIREAAFYGTGIVGTYTAAGFLFALIFGASSLANLATNPVVNLVFAAIFLLLALNLFGVYEITVPTKMLNGINALSSNGTSAGALLLMGLTFTFTSFTCTVPFVGTVMVAAAHGQFLWPFLGMLSYSTAFALPFVLLALFPHALQKLPRSGEWMNSVKVVMGFLELAAVIKFLSNSDLVWQWKMLTRDVFLSTWIAIAGVLVLYLLGIVRMHGESAERPHLSTGRLLLSVVFMTIALFFFTGLKGTPLGTIDAYLPPRDYGSDDGVATASIVNGAEGATVQKVANKKEYAWLDNYEQALNVARQQKKNVFIDFTGYTCTNCRWMEANVFSKPEVDSLLRQYVLVRLYTDGDGAVYEQNQKFEETRFGTIALPMYAVMSAEDQTVAVFSKGMTRDVAEFALFLKGGLAPHMLAEK